LRPVHDTAAEKIAVLSRYQSIVVVSCPKAVATEAIEAEEE
jgi:hypothetical protein